MPDLSRRLFVLGSPMLLAGCASSRRLSVSSLFEGFSDSGYDYRSIYAGGIDNGYTFPAVDLRKIDPLYLRREVADPTGEKPGTIVIDPDNDRGKALEGYADIWKADPKAWRFLTGSLPEVRTVAELFGMSFWSDEGFLTHPFHTVVIDRNGRLAANIEGNQFTAKQLGDFVQTVLSPGRGQHGS